MARIDVRALLAVLALCAGSLQLTGCATNPVTGSNDFVLLDLTQGREVCRILCPQAE